MTASSADPVATRDCVAWHEAGHATIARALGLGVLRASAAEDHPCVVTTRSGGASTQFSETMKRLLVDLAGPLAERRAAGGCDDFAQRHDEENALRRAMWLMTDEHLSVDAEFGAAVVDRLRPRAAALVEEHWAQIGRVAAMLAAGAVLDQAKY